MNFIVFFLFFSCVVISLVSILRNFKIPYYVYFSLLNLLLGLWILSNYFEAFGDYWFAPYLLRADFALAVLMVNFILLFSRSFCGFEKKDDKVRFIIPAYAFVASIFVALTNFVVSNLEYSSDGVTVMPGKLYPVYSILIIAPLAISIFFFVRGFLTSNKVKKVQIKLISLGLIVAAIFLVLTNLLLPRYLTSSFAIKIIPQIGYFGIVLFVLITFYSIARHKFFDIRMVVARSVAYLILLVTLAGIYAGSAIGLERVLFPNMSGSLSSSQTILRTIIAVIMVFLFQPIRTWITRATDAVFFKNRYDVEDVLNELSHTISSTIILVEMLYKVNDILIENLKLSRSAFVIFKNDHEAYTSQAIGYKGWPPIDVPDFLHLAKKGILVYDELEEGSSYKRMLKKYDASIFVPVKLEGELIGVYLAGEKNSGDMFNQNDMEVLDTMAPEVALAVQNAKSYEEISRFNVTLRQEIKRATKRLKDKNEQLKELDKAKDEFISMASHQLRTPLTAIKGYLSMLLEGDAGEIKVSQYDFINEAYSAAGRMVGLINDLLNVSRMETGRFFLEPKEVDIEKMVGEEVKQLQNHAKEKGLYLKIEKKGKVPTISADETKIRQVVMNFIDNAIYYTQKGGVTVKLKKDKDDFIFEVHDTGIGVPKEQARHLFEKFFRADNARQTRPDGTGLGIYLAKRVVEDHGGKVIFESEEGKGSVFGFKFPLKKKTGAAILSPSPDRPTAPALTSAAATFNEKSAGLEGPISAGTVSEK